MSRAALTGPAVANRPIGLALDSSGTIWELLLHGRRGGTQTGGVATVTINLAGAATETEVAGGTTSAGFKKLVGPRGHRPLTVYASDQNWQRDLGDQEVG